LQDVKQARTVLVGKY